MKTRKTMKQERIILWVLVGLLAILSAVLLAVYFLHRDDPAPAASSGSGSALSAAGTLGGSDFSALVYSNGGATLSFGLSEVEEGSTLEPHWQWADDPDFPLDPTHILEILELAAELRPQQTITEGDTLESYGLDRPWGTLTATYRNGGTLRLSLGNATTDGGSCYLLMNGAESPVYIVSGELGDAIRVPVYDMMELPSLPEIKESDMSRIVLSGGERTTVLSAAVTKAGDGEGSADTVLWSVESEDVTDDAATASLVGELRDLSLEKCVDFKPSAGALELCGLGEDAVTVRLTYSGGGVDRVFTLKLGAPAMDGALRYIQLDEDSTVYAVQASRVEALLSVAQNGWEA